MLIPVTAEIFSIQPGHGSSIEAPITLGRTIATGISLHLVATICSAKFLLNVYVFG